MLAGCFAGVADVQDLADLGQREPGATATSNEVHARHGVGPVVPVPVGSTFGMRQQAALLVESNCLGGYPSCRGQFSDAHRLPPSRLTFPLAGRLMIVNLPPRDPRPGRDLHVELVALPLASGPKSTP